MYKKFISSRGLTTGSSSSFLSSRGLFLSSRGSTTGSSLFLILLVLVLHFFWAWQWPILNDESYYWDWSRKLQLSYVDAPPAIAWVSSVNSILFSGIFGVRFLSPILYLFSTIFLIKSAVILLPAQKTKQQIIQANIVVVMLFACIPIFNVYGIFLQPDAPLFFALTGALYFALKSCEKFVLDKIELLSLKHAAALGFFLGLGIASKYQAVPFALGIFFGIVCLRGIKRTFQKDLKFWLMTVAVACLLASPVFIWNLQNNFASIKFQGQHGFLSWNLNLRSFLIYLIEMICVLFPWYFYLCCKQIIASVKKRSFFHSLDVIPISAFCFIFVFIGSSALGKMGKIHWITPVFLFIIPLVAANWNQLTQKHVNFWRNITIGSFVFVSIVFSAIFTDTFQNLLGHNKTPFSASIQKIQNGMLAGMFLYNLENLEQRIQTQIPNINLREKKYFVDFAQSQCAEEPYFAAFNWRWGSQLAFYLEANPRVFVVSQSRSSYYSWRDSMDKLAGCRVFIIGEQSQYKASKIRKIMHIQGIKFFTVQNKFSNHKVDMILVDGIMKDKSTLENIFSVLRKDARY